MASNFPVNFFVPSPLLSAIVINYKNGLLIADQVAPRVQVPLPNFSYALFNKSDFFTIPDTRASRTGLVNQVSWSSTAQTAAVEEHALEELVPRIDQAVAAAYGAYMPDPKNIAAEQVVSLMDLAHEARTANLIFGPGSYGPANKTTLTGQAQWSDYTNSDPLGALANQVQAMTFNSVQPNTMILGQVVWNVLRRHPKLVYSAYGYTGGFAVTEEYVASALGLDRIIVGTSKANLAKLGQNTNWQPIWGKSAALVYQTPTTLSTNTATFAITAEWGSRVASEHFDIDRGPRGSDVVRVGEAHKELILAPDYGYLFQNVIA